MILVVGPNLAVDRTLDVPRFQKGKIFRTRRSLTAAGGKGANVARALRALGAPVHLVGLVAGWTGRFIRDGLAREGIPATLVEVGGLSRTCTIVMDTEQGDATVINETGELAVAPEHLEELDRVLDSWIPRARVVVCSGSLPTALPAGFHARVLERARRAGTVTVVDTSGDALRLAVEHRPHLVKPNRAELMEWAGPHGSDAPLRDPEVATDGAGEGDVDRLTRLARELVAQGVERVVVSMGAAGALAVTHDQAWIARAPRVPVEDPIGAGDSMVAALSRGLHEGLPLDQMLAEAVAAGSCDVSTFGGGLVTPERVRRLQAQVSLSPQPLP